jgi:hypothetical protein
MGLATSVNSTAVSNEVCRAGGSTQNDVPARCLSRIGYSDVETVLEVSGREQNAMINMAANSQIPKPGTNNAPPTARIGIVTPVDESDEASMWQRPSKIPPGSITMHGE